MVSFLTARLRCLLTMRSGYGPFFWQKPAESRDCKYDQTWNWNVRYALCKWAHLYRIASWEGPHCNHTLWYIKSLFLVLIQFFLWLMVTYFTHLIAWYSLQHVSVLSSCDDILSLVFASSLGSRCANMVTSVNGLAWWRQPQCCFVYSIGQYHFAAIVILTSLTF